MQQVTTISAVPMVEKKQNQDKKFIIREIQELTPTQLRMIEQTVSTIILCDYNVAKASKKLRLTARAVHQRLAKYPIIREKLKEFNDTTNELAREKLKANSLNASHAVVDLMNNSKSERMILDSATQILDRAGITKPDTNIQVNVLNNLRKDKDDYDL
jgi:hypothetical protein